MPACNMQRPWGAGWQGVRRPVPAVAVRWRPHCAGWRRGKRRLRLHAGAGLVGLLQAIPSRNRPAARRVGLAELVPHLLLWALQEKTFEELPAVGRSRLRRRTRHLHGPGCSNAVVRALGGPSEIWLQHGPGKIRELSAANFFNPRTPRNSRPHMYIML